MRISSRITALKYKCLYNSLLYINRNNAETKRYQEEGLKLLSGKVDSLPSKIAFRPKFIKQSSCIKVFDKLYLFISKANIKKPLEERFDALFHEIGHWLHFQNIPPLKECREIWKTANLEKIKDRLPVDKIQDFSCNTDSCSFSINPVGSLGLRIIEREPYKTIKFETEKSPVPLFLWIQLLPVTDQETKIKITCRAELNMLIKGMVSKPLQDGIEKLADMLTTITYE